MFKKAFINFAMIQTVIIASSIGAAARVPIGDFFTLTLWFWILASAVSFFPSIIVSVLFTHFQKD
jgi:F0F1-type ATP synthase membrane subunit c/vacuolar-type H+-ATPase subunit K